MIGCELTKQVIPCLDELVRIFLSNLTSTWICRTHLYRTCHRENKCKSSGALEGGKGIFESDGLSWKETTVLHSYSFIILDLFVSVLQKTCERTGEWSSQTTEAHFAKSFPSLRKERDLGALPLTSPTPFFWNA